MLIFIVLVFLGKDNTTNPTGAVVAVRCRGKRFSQSLSFFDVSEDVLIAG